MKIRFIYIGMLFISTCLLPAASGPIKSEQKIQFKNLSIQSLLHEFVSNPQQFESSLGPDLLDKENPSGLKPTVEQLQKRVLFCKEIKEKIEHGLKALLIACDQTLPICCSLSINAGVGPNVIIEGVYDFPITPLSFSIIKKNVTMIKRLLQLKADINFAADTATPLQLAITSEDKPIVKLLLAHGANPNHMGPLGTPPIALAAVHAIPGIIKALLEYGADPNIKSILETPAICLAAFRKNTKSIKALIKGGADVDQQAADGQTALHVAADKNHAEIIKILLAHGANPDIKTTCYGKQILADITGEPLNDSELLCLATALGYTEVVKDLLSKRYSLL